MALITLFSAPKAFTDPTTAMMQWNAIRSWTLLDDVDVLLLGEEDGLEDAARELGVRHSADVTFNPNGVPLISSMLKVARETYQNPLLCIINADIILMSDFVEAARQVEQRASVRPLQNGYVLLSRRWDLAVKAPLNFSHGWEQRVQEDVQQRGSLHRPTGSDFFLFPRGCYADVPDFAIGRAGWDNWMIYRARKEGWPVIDGTPSITIIHQNHDYRHLPGARPHYDHPDTRVNTQLAGG
ncbi:MAG: glycosyltransferase, partial [Anaerolineae bacterium]